MGKTSFLRRLCEARFSPGMAATVGEFSAPGGNGGLMGRMLALAGEWWASRNMEKPISPGTARLLSSWCVRGVERGGVRWGECFIVPVLYLGS